MGQLDDIIGFGVLGILVVCAVLDWWHANFGRQHREFGDWRDGRSEAAVRRRRVIAARNDAAGIQRDGNEVTEA